MLLAAHLPSKQDERVRDPSHALIRSSMVEHPAVNRGVEGSRPSGPAYASVAQRRQQLTVNQPQRNTGGSSPPGALIYFRGQTTESPPCHGGDSGAAPVGSVPAPVAQLVVHLTCNQKVSGSKPDGSFMDL